MRDTLHIDGGGGEREVRAADFDLVKELHTRDLDELAFHAPRVVTPVPVHSIKLYVV